MMLERVTPFQNSKIPVTLVDALVPNLSPIPRRSLDRKIRRGGRWKEIGALVLAVGYAMQPQRLPLLQASGG